MGVASQNDARQSGACHNQAGHPGTTEADLPADWREQAAKPKQKETAPRGRNPVDDDYIRNGGFDFLTDLGWKRSGDNYAHPHTDKPISLSIIKADDGTRVAHSFTPSVPHLTEGGNYNAFDLYRLLCHDGDAEAAQCRACQAGLWPEADYPA